jgi:hypothetical protein
VHREQIFVMPQHEHRRPARLATTSRTSAWNGDRFAGRRADLGQRLRRTDVAIVRQLASTTPECGYVEQPDITAIMSASLYGAYAALIQISRGFTLKLGSIRGHRSPRLRRRAHRRNTVFRLSSSPECAATQRSAFPWQSAGTGFQPGSSGGSCPQREHLPSAQCGAEFGVLRIVPSVEKRPPAVVLEHCQGIASAGSTVKHRACIGQQRGMSVPPSPQPSAGMLRALLNTLVGQLPGGPVYVDRCQPAMSAPAAVRTSVCATSRWGRSANGSCSQPRTATRRDAVRAPQPLRSLNYLGSDSYFFSFLRCPLPFPVLALPVVVVDEFLIVAHDDSPNAEAVAAPYATGFPEDMTLARAIPCRFSVKAAALVRRCRPRRHACESAGEPGPSTSHGR